MLNKGGLKICLSFLLTLIVVSSNSAQVNKLLADNLQHTLDSVKTSYNLVGVSAAVVLPDQSIWTGVRGTSDPINQDSITPDMLFGIGSITKTFTTAIIMQLAAENKLSLDDSIYKWLPAYPNIDSTITIRHLLSHTSGIYNYTNSSSFWNTCNQDLKRYFSPEELINFVMAPSFVKGTSWEYSNTNFILLGMIIKKITGSEFSTEMHKRITVPYNLSGTFLRIEDTITDKIADEWTDTNYDGMLENFSTYPKTAIYSGAWTAGAMFSTAENIARWAKYLYGGNVVEQKYLNQMVNFTAISGYFYGLGTIRSVLQNHVFWGHSGGVPGYHTYMGYSSKDNISIAVLLNSDDKDPEIIASSLIKVILEYKPVIVKDDSPVLSGYSLSQNYPNPFNPITRIKYAVGSTQYLKLKVYDMLGNEVVTLVNEMKAPGEYEIEFNSIGLSSGTYFYELTAGSFPPIKKTNAFEIGSSPWFSGLSPRFSV